MIRRKDQDGSKKKEGNERDVDKNENLYNNDKPIRQQNQGINNNNDNNNRGSNSPRNIQHHKMPLSMQIMRPLAFFSCTECGQTWPTQQQQGGVDQTMNGEHSNKKRETFDRHHNSSSINDDDNDNFDLAELYNQVYESFPLHSVVSPFCMAPMMMAPTPPPTYGAPMQCHPISTSATIQPDNNNNNNNINKNNKNIHDKNTPVIAQKSFSPSQEMVSTQDSQNTLQYKAATSSLQTNSSSSSLSSLPFPLRTPHYGIESMLLQQYLTACQFYQVSPNSGVLTTLRYNLPALRVAGPFHDADMLALAEVLMPHINQRLSYLRRLDFSRSSKEGKLHGHYGFRSHGALALARILAISTRVQEVRIQRHRIGPFGASAIFLALQNNTSLLRLHMRRCRIGERGGVAFAELICPSRKCALQDVNLSANKIGFHGCFIIEEALQRRDATRTLPWMSVDLEGNLVFQEVMNGITHGLGIIFAIFGGMAMSRKVEDKSMHHVIACGVYSTSLFVLYTASTLYHSFFSLQNTKYIFEVVDKCAIYILISGSYTPFLQIALLDNHIWSIWLLAFIWLCCVGGIIVEAVLPTWRHKLWFSILMYLGMGWCCVICLPDLCKLLPQGAMNLLVMGGVGYTSGVPFFVRNNNLDHSIWHLFVLSASIFHWACIYFYVAPMDLPTTKA